MNIKIKMWSQRRVASVVRSGWACVPPPSVIGDERLLWREVEVLEELDYAFD